MSISFWKMKIIEIKKFLNWGGNNFLISTWRTLVTRFKNNLRKISKNSPFLYFYSLPLWTSETAVMCIYPPTFSITQILTPALIYANYPPIIPVPHPPSSIWPDYCMKVYKNPFFLNTWFCYVKYCKFSKRWEWRSQRTECYSICKARRLNGSSDSPSGALQIT